MTSDGNRVQLRMDVVGPDGDRIGSVKEVRSTDFLLDRSMQRDVYVPFSAIRQVSGNVVTLSVAAGAIDNQGWPTPPMMGGTA